MKTKIIGLIMLAFFTATSVAQAADHHRHHHMRHHREHHHRHMR